MKIFLKCLLTGLVYAVITSIVQVPIAGAVNALLSIRQDDFVKSDMVPFLLLSMLVVGVAFGFFYYLFGHLFTSRSKWMQGMKFSLFIYLSNYIPQVFFLDAARGFKALVTGGFPVIQVELYDGLILVATALCMVWFMPCRRCVEKSKKTANWCKSLVCGGVFAVALCLLQEVLLPMLGFGSMAEGLGVSSENLLFFYTVLLVSFVLTGTLVALYAEKSESPGKFFASYAVLVWCFFDVTMIPLGFGLTATLLFVLNSLIAFGAAYSVYRVMK